MPEYKSNPDKPEKILTGYGTVRSPELKIIYQDIEKETALSKIKQRYGRPRGGQYETEHIEECLRFLRTLDMIEEVGENTLNRINRALFTDFDLSFEARLLYHICQQTGRQFHLAEIHDVAVRELSSDGDHYGVRRVSVDDLVTAMRRNTDYDLRWRSEKIEMWANLLAPAGAVSYASKQDEIIAGPSRALLHELLSLHQQHREDGDNLVAALEWIEESFFPVFSRRGGNPAVHVGVADVFESMAREEVLTLRGMSDRVDAVDLPKRIDNTMTPSDYEIETAPDRPSYWYPLERNERRLSA